MGANKVETLVLADNELREVSGQLGRLRTLRMLDLRHNRLTTVPDKLGDLDALSDFLYLHDNDLRSLPPSLEKLTHLRYAAPVPLSRFWPALRSHAEMP